MSVDAVRVTCPRCETEVSTDARFCMSCGMSLGDPSADDAAREQKVVASAPSPLVDKMRAAKLTGERKPVTALFADVVGSTTLAESMDPEDWTQIVNEAFDLMSKAVFHYEGTIAQLQGDAMLAFFGAPVAHEDDPDRAIRAALEMIEQIDEYARQLQRTHGIEFRIRAGINTGPVIVGNVGSDLRYEYTALGDAVNVAARVQTSAEPRTVLVTANTMRFAADAFDFEDLGDIELKGKTEPVQLYRVIGIKAQPGRRRGLESVGLSSPLVGRSAELESLRALFEVAVAGRGRVAVLIGEPGIGKSRLLAELRALIPTATWVEGKCVTYGRTVPYHLVLDMVRSMLGISLSNSEAEERQIMTTRLRELLGDEASDVGPYIAHLLSLPLSQVERDMVQVDPEMLQSRYVAAIFRVIRGHLAAGPLVLVCEDIHWADPASVEMVIQLMALMTTQPVLLILAGRNETDSPGWRLVTQVRTTMGDALTEIRLQPLSDDASRELVSNLLEIESLPEQVRDKILERAEGNPFFVEEVIRMLIERGAIVRSTNRWVADESITAVEIPETLHSLLLARIDQLPDDAKRSLRVASVIGRQFPVRVLERVLATE
ncbi:MAG TPA: adenylate/guanylate cyclase domain-containing protein [Candidatus Limnocylindrales bacterium]|nr:adenylate/guanylate cyclase domain-containing protein [Candidatus Limnocylindrales bacterium]